MSWLARLIPSRAAIAAALAALVAAILAFARRDARKDARRDAKLEDLETAHEIDTRVDRDRADPERLRPFDGAGYRD